MNINGKQYSVIGVTEGHEREARRLLRSRREYSGLCKSFRIPLYKTEKTIRHKKSKSVATVNEVLFQGYLFAEFNNDHFWPALLSCPCVEYVITSYETNLPFKIPGAVLKAFEDADFDERPKMKISLLNEGDEVIIIKGILEGKSGVVMKDGKIYINGQKVKVPRELIKLTEPKIRG